jgi:hypothetical protein
LEAHLNDDLAEDKSGDVVVAKFAAMLRDLPKALIEAASAASTDLKVILDPIVAADDAPLGGGGGGRACAGFSLVDVMERIGE